jgi:hypothetical protein
MHGDTVFVDMCHASIIPPRHHDMVYASPPEFLNLAMIPRLSSHTPEKVDFAVSDEFAGSFELKEIALFQRAY